MTLNNAIDGYAHIGLPRFQTAEGALAGMDDNGMESAMVCPFETCPDLVEVHRAYTIAPDRFRIFGLTLGGSDRSLVEKGMHAQFDAGFMGMRVSLERIAEVPFVLDVMAERQGIPLVVTNQGGHAPQAERLLAFLNAHPASIIVSPHMAGPTNPAIFADNKAVRDLFAHPNFYVVASRQTLFDPATMSAWGRALVEHVGWDRLIWGSEAPVLYWRDETIAAAAAWIDQFAPTSEQRQAFFSGNAKQAVFSRAVPAPQPLVLPYEPFDYELKRLAPMWPQGFNADTDLPAALVAGWMAQGGPQKQPLSAYVSALLVEAVSAREAAE